MDHDAGALDLLDSTLFDSERFVHQIPPLLGDITALTLASGMLGREHTMLLDAFVCQAVLHHFVITQGVSMQFAVDALAAFGAPMQIEFATEDDEKVHRLLSQIPNWKGEYSTGAPRAALHERCEQVRVADTLPLLAL